MQIRDIDDFTSQYTGEWDPVEGHWYGLNFSYNGTRYRFNTWSEANKNLTVLPDGRKARFGLLKKFIRKPEIYSAGRICFNRGSALFYGN